MAEFPERGGLYLTLISINIFLLQPGSLSRSKGLADSGLGQEPVDNRLRLHTLTTQPLLGGQIGPGKPGGRVLAEHHLRDRLAARQPVRHAIAVPAGRDPLVVSGPPSGARGQSAHEGERVAGLRHDAGPHAPDHGRSLDPVLVPRAVDDVGEVGASLVADRRVVRGEVLLHPLVLAADPDVAVGRVLDPVEPTQLDRPGLLVVSHVRQDRPGFLVAHVGELASGRLGRHRPSDGVDSASHAGEQMSRVAVGAVHQPSRTDDTTRSGDHIGIFGIAAFVVENGGDWGVGFDHESVRELV